MNLKHWNESTLELDSYRDGDEDQMTARAEHVAALDPDRAQQFGSWESWSEEDVYYLMEELAGGFRWSAESTVSAGPAFLVARAIAAATLEGRTLDPPAVRVLLDDLLHALRFDLEEAPAACGVVAPAMDLPESSAGAVLH